MRVNPNSGPAEVVGTDRSTSTPPRLGQDQLALTGADALNSALAQTPDVRPEKVALGKGFLSDATYPPDALINGLARLLAAKLSQSQDSQG
jgi:hypothetical protein